MQYRFLSFIVLTSLVFFLVAPSFSATVSVEKDGSGDYSVIQDAVDAAASGDTILIGSGRFDEGQIVTTPGWSYFTRILVNQQELTLIGSGPSSTIVGSKDVPNTAEANRGIFVWDEWGNNKLHVEGILFENISYPFESIGTESVIVKNCTFLNTRGTIILDGVDSVYLGNCRVSGAVEDYLAACWSVNDFKMENCNFDLEEGSDAPNLYLQGSVVAQVGGCMFSGGNYGILVLGDTLLDVNNCVFQGHLRQGIAITGGGTKTVRNTRLLNSRIGIEHVGIEGGTIKVDHCLFQNMSLASIAMRSPLSGYINDCDLTKGAEYVVINQYIHDKKYSDVKHFDMRNNWWGTTDPDSIQAWIYDHKDFADIRYIIDWDPYSDEPVPTKNDSMGGVKAMYR